MQHQPSSSRQSKPEPESSPLCLSKDLYMLFDGRTKGARLSSILEICDHLICHILQPLDEMLEIDIV